MSATNRAGDAVRRDRVEGSDGAGGAGGSEGTVRARMPSGSFAPGADPGLRTSTRPDAATGDRPLAWWLLVGGLIGLVAAGTLLVEKIRLLSDNTYVPSCSLNPVLSCGSVMQTAQSEVFGFPNPILGVVGFSVVVAVGTALLAGASFDKWFWQGLQVGMVLGLVLVHWLIFQSLYRIGALCPYCMVVWAVTIPIVLHASLHIARIGTWGPATRWFATRAGAYHPALLTAWYVLVLALITAEFWAYWQTLLL